MKPEDLAPPFRVFLSSSKTTYHDEYYRIQDSTTRIIANQLTKEHADWIVHILNQHCDLETKSENI